MPIYEFVCVKCADIVEEFRAVGDNAGKACAACGEKRIKVPSVPMMHTWCTDREFPNLSKTGNGKMSFGSKSDYESYLKRNNIGELSHDAPKKTKPGSTVTVYE